MGTKFQISAKQLEFPRYCACCMEPATKGRQATAKRVTGKNKQTVHTQSWTVPYCDLCERHIEEFEQIEQRSVVQMSVVLLADLAIVLLVAFTDLEFSFFTALLLATVTIAGVAGVTSNRTAKVAALEESKRRTCTCDKEAVTYLEWHGATHTFEFTNSAFLEAVSAANATKRQSIPGSHVGVQIASYRARSK